MSLSLGSFKDKIRQIIVAEDQALNLHVLKNQLSKLDLLARTTFCTDGQEAINRVKTILDQKNFDVWQPISIMLLDF